MKNIAIDGPAGAGKSTIAKIVAQKIKATYVDTGALYRVLALFALNNNVNPNDSLTLSVILNDVSINLEYIDGNQHVFLNGEDVSDKIRSEEVGNIASIISAQAAVREKLLDIQRDIAKSTNVVMDGRDIGTVVLPDAYLKIFLTASIETRAKRRAIQLIESGVSIDEDKIKQDIINRDEADKNRSISPLKRADDAIFLDSSDMSPDEVVSKIVGFYEEKK